MTSWQKRLRTVLAIFGIVFAGLVYRSIGERKAPTPAGPVERFDPKAVLETTAAAQKQLRGSEREFEIKSDRTLAYADGSARHFNVAITVPRPGGRIYYISAKEALAGPKQVELQLTGGIKLSTNDGFQLIAKDATFNQNESVARVQGEVTFQRGRMSGSGLGATYDQANDVLQIAENAHITIVNADGQLTSDGTAGKATLDRLNDVLFLDSSVRMLRSSQLIEAGQVMARLSMNEEVITYLELRGGSSVHGGQSSIESMKASAIDLDYTDDGETLERVILNDQASVALSGDGGAPGRRMSGGSLDLILAADGSVTSLTANEKVRFELPATGGAPSRTIEASALTASGEAGKGLTVARFRENVVFREGEGAGKSSREVRSQNLNASLEGDGVSNAVFSGGVTFDERGLKASSTTARYQPANGILNLSGADERSGSRVSDDQITVDAAAVDVTLDGRGIVARGNVRTSLRDRRGRSEDGQAGNRLPGLLESGVPASINAEKLDYSGAEGRAVYSGRATLVQGDTAIRGDTITLDQKKGDLSASGSARSTLILGKGRTDGVADDIRYVEATRVVSYSMTVAPKGPATAAAAAVPTAPAKLALLSGPEGDLRGQQIELVLAKDGNALDRLEARTNVTMVVGGRTAVGGRLTYYTRDERYVMSSVDATPVTIREACRETIGRTLTFFKSTDRIVVDGNDTSRTETRPCASQPAR